MGKFLQLEFNGNPFPLARLLWYLVFIFKPFQEFFSLCRWWQIIIQNQLFGKSISKSKIFQEYYTPGLSNQGVESASNETEA